MYKKKSYRWLTCIACGLLVLSLIGFGGTSAEAGRTGGGRGSFGGGGRSFGGGSSFGGGRSSFGGGSSPRSSFGGSSPRGGSGSFGSRSSSGMSAPPRSPGSSSFRSTSTPGAGSSFGRSGSFQSSGYVRSTTVAPRYASQRPSYQSTVNYYGTPTPAYHYGFGSGFSLGWAAATIPWYFHTPFHPAFYYHPPVYYNGGLYPGGFNWLNFFIGLAVIGFIVWVVYKLFTRGRRVKYTVYE